MNAEHTDKLLINSLFFPHSPTFHKYKTATVVKQP